MKKNKSIVGNKYGKLLVLEYTEKRNSNRNIIWKCLCECGNISYVATSALKSGHTKSCGCSLNYNTFSEAGKKGGAVGKHYLSRTKLYKTYNHMVDRCYNNKNISYKHYGARGIKVCDEWLNKENGLINFYNWANDNGYRDDLTIDRIDVNGDYGPGNCRWATIEQQANNKRNNCFIEYEGEKYTISQLSKKINIKYYSLYRQIKRLNKWR